MNCDVGAGSLIVIAIDCMLQSQSAWAAPCNISWVRSSTVTGSSPSTLIFPFQYHSTNGLHAFLS